VVRASVNEVIAEISVTDTGIGIAPEDQETVFEEFRQVGKTDKKAEGTGLGLALRRKFVELHGGRMRVKNQVGVGSNVHVHAAGAPWRMSSSSSSRSRQDP
jgi:signal transduction histidine kinase